MSEKHLTIGSEDPPLVDGLLRLYSMLYCPFAQRSRLVLKAKGVPHDIVNINLFKKPEWYFKIHPEGKVPALIDGSKIIVESLDICDYLDEKYPTNPLYPAEPLAKQKDKELIQKIGEIHKVFGSCVYLDEKKTPEEWVQAFLKVCKVFEDELAKRGTPFFGGDKPGMVDYMLWPAAERGPVCSIKLGVKLPFQEKDLVLLRKWRKTMSADSVCAELHIKAEKFWEIIQKKVRGEDPYINI